jgi:hypothetical protein
MAARRSKAAKPSGAGAAADVVGVPGEGPADGTSPPSAGPESTPPLPPLDGPTDPQYAGRPRIPTRTEWIDLPGDYGKAGMKMRVWVDYEFRYSRGVRRTGDIQAALDAIILEHNGWLDQRGRPLPQIGEDPLFWWREDVPPELVVLICGLLEELPKRYPKSLGMISDVSLPGLPENVQTRNRPLPSSDPS